MMGYGKKSVRENIAKGVQRAGKELVETKSVSLDTMETIEQPLFTSKKEGFHGLGNLFWKTCIAEGVTPKEFEKKGMIPRPDSVESFMVIFKMGFNPRAQQVSRPSCSSVSADLWKGIAILASKTGR